MPDAVDAAEATRSSDLSEPALTTPPEEFASEKSGLGAAPSNWREAIGLYLRGAAIGGSDLVPGFSGGTMALVLGIYQRLLESVGAFSRAEFWRELVRGRFGAAFRSVDGAFLLLVAAGLFSAIRLLSPLVSYLLSHFPTLVAAFFFGLVLASTAVAGRRVGRWSAVTTMLVATGAVGAFVLVGLTPAQISSGFWFLLIAGAVAVCALVLPGLSGAFVLVLLGKYDVALQAVVKLDLSVILPLGLGAVVGLLSFARLLAYLLRHHHDKVMALLTGFILGSLRKVWPYLQPGGAPTWPWGVLDSNVWLVTVVVLAGCAAVLLLERGGAARASSS